MIPADAQAFGLGPDSPLTVERWTMYGGALPDTFAIEDSRNCDGYWIVRIAPEPWQWTSRPIGELHAISPADIAEALEYGAALGAEFYLTDSPMERADATIRMLPGDGLPELAERIAAESSPCAGCGAPIRREDGGYIHRDPEPRCGLHPSPAGPSPETVRGLSSVLAFGDVREYDRGELEDLESRMARWTMRDRAEWESACQWIERLND